MIIVTCGTQKKFSKNTEVTFLFETYNFQPSYLIGDKYEVHGGQNNTSISLYLSKKISGYEKAYLILRFSLKT